jgi:hypothetical protein
VPGKPALPTIARSQRADTGLCGGYSGYPDIQDFNAENGVSHYQSSLSFLIRSLMSDWRVIIQPSLRQPRPSIDKGLTSSSPHLSLTKLKAEPQ